MTATCVGCGTDFAPKRCTHKYCNPICRERQRVRPTLKARACSQCKAIFVPSASNGARFCSKACWGESKRGKLMPWAKAHLRLESGERFGRWTVLGFDRYQSPDPARTGHLGHKAMWLCRCDCGNERAVWGTALTDSSSQSCGCLRRERIKTAAAQRREHGPANRALTNGYCVVRCPDDAPVYAGRWEAEHRYLMARSLGRELQPGENVHHVNGDRKDNRLENLELWDKRQPTGQRVEDRLAWCAEYLREHGRLSNDAHDYVWAG